MAIERPEKIPEAKISSIDIVSFNGGLDQRGEANITPNSFSEGRNVMVTKQGLATHRFGLKRWLPDLEESHGGGLFPALYGGEIYYLTADDGKIKYIKDGQSSWTDCGGDNVVTTTEKVRFLRALDKVFILNGIDKLGYVDLSNLEVVHYEKVDDPTTEPEATASGLSGSNHKVYYAYTYNSVVGETACSPIKTLSVGKIRDRWKDDGTENVKVTRTAAPANATSWNVYVATAAAGGSIAPTDMLPLAMGLDISVLEFTDDGGLAVNLDGGTAPEDNSTEGPKAKYGLELNGRPFLFGDPDNPYNLYIGGNGDHATDFSPTNGGYVMELNKGTNYYPMSVVGFRSGLGNPSITVLFSNTEGLAKQSIIEQQTISYGNYSFVVWGQTEQNYGAAGVSSPDGVVNYKGGLHFPTTDGFVKMDTQASLQNVLSQDRISDPVVHEIETMKNRKLRDVVGAAWDNRVIWSVATRGFEYNNKLLIYDVSNKDLQIWYTFDILSQWVGVVSPENSAAFVYIRQGKTFYRLQKTYVAQDELSDGTTRSFPMELKSGLIGANTAHNGFHAVVQVVFYLLDFIGEVELSVTYRDYYTGRMKTKSKKVNNGEYAKSSVGGWSSPGYLFNQNLPTKVLRWGEVDEISDAQVSHKSSRRERIKLNNVITNEMQAGIAVNLDDSSVIARSVSFEGQNLGISPDIR